MPRTKPRLAAAAASSRDAESSRIAIVHSSGRAAGRRGESRCDAAVRWPRRGRRCPRTLCRPLQAGAQAGPFAGRTRRERCTRETCRPERPRVERSRGSRCRVGRAARIMTGEAAEPGARAARRPPDPGEPSWPFAAAVHRPVARRRPGRGTARPSRRGSTRSTPSRPRPRQGLAGPPGAWSPSTACSRCCSPRPSTRTRRVAAAVGHGVSVSVARGDPRGGRVPAKAMERPAGSRAARAADVDGRPRPAGCLRYGPCVAGGADPAPCRPPGS